MEKRLQGAEDKGKPITVRRHDAKPPTSTGPITFGAPVTGPIQFVPTPSAPPLTAPSANTGDTASVMAVDPARATQPAVYTPILDGCVNQLEVRMDKVEKRCESMDSKLDRLVAATCGKHTPKLRKRASSSPCSEGIMAGMTTWFVTHIDDSDTWEARPATVLTVTGDEIRGTPWSPEALPIPGIDIQGDRSHPMTEEEARNTALK